MLEQIYNAAPDLPWYYQLIIYPIYYICKYFMVVVHYLTPHSPFGIILMFAISYLLIKKNGWARIFWVIVWALYFIKSGFSTTKRNNARKRLAKTNPNYIYRKK